MPSKRKRSIVTWNVVLLLLLLAFMAGVYFDVTIEMKSLAVTATGLIFFPVLFVLVNMGILNQRYPLSAQDRPEEAARHGSNTAGDG